MNVEMHAKKIYIIKKKRSYFVVLKDKHIFSQRLRIDFWQVGKFITEHYNQLLLLQVFHFIDK